MFPNVLQDRLVHLVACTLPYTGALVERFSELNNRLQQLAGLTGQLLVDALFPPATPGCADIRGAATAVAADHPAPADLLQELRTVMQKRCLVPSPTPGHGVDGRTKYK